MISLTIRVRTHSVISPCPPVTLAHTSRLVFFAYAVITTSTSTLYIDPEQLSPSTLSSQPGSSASSTSEKSGFASSLISADHLPSAVEIKHYTDIWADLTNLGANAQKVLVGNKASMKVLESINNATSRPTSSAAHIASTISSLPPVSTASATTSTAASTAEAKTSPVGILVRSPIADLKSIKNETEVYGFRACHVRDGVALARYFAWLEEVLEKGEEEVSEWKAAEVLEDYRS